MADSTSLAAAASGPNAQAAQEGGAPNLSQHLPNLVSYLSIVSSISLILLSKHLSLSNDNDISQAGSVLNVPDNFGGSLLIRIQNMSATGK